jgi:hypothetical protein
MEIHRSIRETIREMGEGIRKDNARRREQMEGLPRMSGREWWESRGKTE